LDVRPSPTPRPSSASTGPGHLLHSASPDPSVAAPAPLTVIAAIPARYASTRLPGKPLLPISGRPMIEHVYHRVGLARGLARIVVLTDDERIARAVEAFGGEVEMTPADCASGTDRIAHAARRWPATAAVVNVQGDEPLIDPEAVSAIVAHLAAHPEDPVVTLAAPLAGGSAQAAADLANPNVVKVVLGASGHALYFSRAAIPYARQQGGGAAALRHLGIYGYQRAALLRLASLPPTPLERTEALEQLRALENGISIRVLVRAGSQPGVDTREDLERVERMIEEAAGAMAPLAAD
jgi:3-deoxy-manno-octulosonate cytidylyltransferase (CMP-KDO synthetase)